MAGPGSGQNTDQNANQNAPQQGQNANNNTNAQTEEERRAESRRREISNLQQAALLHDRIAAAERHIEARQNPQQAPKPKQKKSAWGTFKHGLFTALSAVSAVTVGGFFWLVSSPFIPTKKYYQEARRVKTQADTNIIPGTKNDRFQDPDVDHGADNQPIIDDVRRLPLVYEREIFDDLNQKPTITLHFKQAKEGSNVAISSKMKAGHAFLTLKYTKTDPLTGKEKRYQTTVGFGAQANALTGGAQLLNGMFVPGVINDEFGAGADVSKEYEITNKAMNKVILGIQKFAPGGYQLMKRNCTTFVAEMAKEAGLEEQVKDFLKEVDFETEANPILPLAVPGVLIGGPTATELGRYGAYKDVGKINYAYGQFGQYLYNKDDFLRIEKMELNARLYGYDPSSSGEALRNMTGTGLNSTAYGNNIVNGKIPKSANVGKDANKILKYRFQTMQQSMNGAKRSLQAVLDKKFPNCPKNTELMRFLEETSNLFRVKIDALYTPEILVQPKQRRELYISFWKEISEKMKTLNDYYINYYQGNPEVNIRFQHMSSLCANMKTLILRCEEFQKDRTSSLEKDIIADYIDTSRDSAKALRLLYFSNKEFDMPDKVWRANPNDENLHYTRIQLAELAAGLKVFGNLKDCVRYHILRKMEKKTRAETKEFALLSKRGGAINAFLKAQESYAGKRPFSMHDYKYAFVDLPQAEKESGFQFRSYDQSPSALYQSIALERIFGGLKTKLAEEMVKNDCSQESLYEVVCNHMAAAIEQNKEEYLQLVRCLYLDEKHNYQKFDRSKDEQSFKEYCLEKANARIMKAFLKSYQDPIFTDFSSVADNTISAAKKLKLKLYNMAEQPLQDLPAFKVVREQICKVTGIQPLLSEKRSEAIQTLRKWKEAETRKKQEAQNPEAVPANAKRRNAEEPEITPAKLKECVETLLKVDACYADLLSANKLPQPGGSAVTEDDLNKIQVSIAEKEVEPFAHTLLSCCSTKKPLAVSKEELRLVDVLKKEDKLYKKVNLLEEEPIEKTNLI